MLICKIEKWINKKLTEPMDRYNDSTFDWHRGYKKALNDILGLIELLKH